MRGRQWLLGVITFLLAACGCTDVGCEDSFFVRFAEPLPDANYEFTLCIDDQCLTRTADLSFGNPRVIEGELGVSAVGVSWKRTPQGGETVRLVVSSSLGENYDLTFDDVEFDIDRPNGPFCTPECRNVELIVP